MENPYFTVKGTLSQSADVGFYHSCSNLGVFATKGAVRVPPHFSFTLGSVSGTNQSGGFWSNGYVSCLFAPF